MSAPTLELSGKTIAAEFERRAARAVLLADGSPSAADTLRFASVLLKAQGDLARLLFEIPELDGHIADDAPHIAALSRPLLETVERFAPPELSDSAGDRLAEDNSTAEERFAQFWSGDASARDDYLVRATLRPYVEVLRARHIAPDRLHDPGHCPFCGGAPSVAMRRPVPDADGIARFLVCALCGCEWITKRNVCSVCAEDDASKLPIYRSETHPEVRIEACETCRCYIKSIDLTRDALPIAEIDDLVSMSLDLWAAEQGFTRTEPGLAGV